MGAVVYQRIGQNLQFADVFRCGEENEYRYGRAGRTSIGSSNGASNMIGGIRGASDFRDYVPEVATSLLLSYLQYLHMPEFTNANDCGRQIEDLEDASKPDTHARRHSWLAGSKAFSPSASFQSQSHGSSVGKQESTSQNEIRETPSRLSSLWNQPNRANTKPETRKKLAVTTRLHSLPPLPTPSVKQSFRSPSVVPSIESGIPPTLDLKEDVGWASKESRWSKNLLILTDDNVSTAAIARNTVEASGLLFSSNTNTHYSGFKSHASNQSQEGSTTSSGETSTPKESGNKNQKRQCSGSDEEDDAEPDEKPNRPRKRRARSPAEDLNEKRLRCPFNAFDPQRYSEKNLSEKLYRGCSTGLLTSIPRLKQHLYRVHKKPENYCRRCFEVYESEEVLGDHLHQTRPCSVTEAKFGDKMSALQLANIKRRDCGKTTEEKWFGVFRTLFPDSIAPASPYVEDTPNTNTLEGVFDFFRRRIPPVMTEDLSSMGYLNEGTTYLTASGVIPDVIEKVIKEYHLLQTTGREPEPTKINTKSIRKIFVASSSPGPEGRPLRVIRAHRGRPSTKWGKESRRPAVPAAESRSSANLSGHQQPFGYEDQPPTTLYNTYQSSHPLPTPNPPQYSSSGMGNMAFYHQANDIQHAESTGNYETSSFTHTEPADCLIDTHQNSYIQHTPPASNQAPPQYFHTNFHFPYSTAVDPAKTESPTECAEAGVWPNPYVDVDPIGPFI